MLPTLTFRTPPPPHTHPCRNRHQSASRRVPLTFNSAYDPTVLSDASGLELYNKHQHSSAVETGGGGDMAAAFSNATINPVYRR